MSRTTTLGIETSCDETSVALVQRHRILANIVASSLKEHAPYGGVVPEIASRAHLEAVVPCLECALRKSKMTLKEIGLIAVTVGPGLMGSLLVGVSAAKALALALRKPLIGVDHVLAHLYAGHLADPKLRFPYLGLAVSGGHTLIIRMDSPSRYRVLGRTLDDAAGEAFDKVAKILGLRYPGGPEIDRLSRGEDPNQFLFTRPYLSNDSFDFSFSGIKTAVYTRVEKLKKERFFTAATKRGLCAGFQEAVCEALTKKTVAAGRKEGLKRVVVGGGVSANKRLRVLLTKAAEAEGLGVLFPQAELTQDNAAMIAALGAVQFEERGGDPLDLSAYSDFFKGSR